MTTYRVEIDGETVWSDETPEYESKRFPAEYRDRPKKGAVHLYVDDELIAVQKPMTKAEKEEHDAGLAADRKRGIE